MAAARTIPDIQKRRTCITIFMSYHIRSSSPKLSVGTSWHLRTTGAKGVLRAEPVPTFALSFASLRLRRTHLRNCLNLLNFAPSIQEDQFVPYSCSDC